MRQAWRVSDVRAAEKALMATLPDGTLMQRAAAGLARRCVLLLEEAAVSTAPRCFLLVGSGDNGGDTLYAGARLAARGARVRALLLAPTGCTWPGSPRCAGRAVSPCVTCPIAPIWCSTASSGSAPAVDCGRRPRRSPAPWPACADAGGSAAAGGRGGRAERRRRGHRRRARRRGDRGRDRDVRLPETRARGGSGRDPGRAGRAGRHRARRDPARRSGDPGAGRRRHRRLVAAARTEFRQVHARGGRRRDRLGALSRRRRAVGGRGAAPARPAWSGMRAAPTRTSCVPIRRWWRRRGWPTPAGCRPGCAVPGSAPTTTPAPSCARCSPPRCRCCWTPTR